MKKSLLLLAVLLFVGAEFATAQNFTPRILGFSKKKTSYVTLQDGSEVEGTFKKFKMKKGLFKSITLTTSSGDKTFAADQLASMRLAPSAMGKLGAMSESTQSLKRAQDSDIGAISDREFVYFESAMLELKKGEQPVMLQVVNPGFDSVIKVYDDPRAQETGGVSVGGIQATGGVLKSYYIVQDGKAVKIKKGDYKDEFGNLYPDCPAMAKEFEKIDWDDFPKHVYFYTENCK